MESPTEELYFYFVEKPHLDAFPTETPALRAAIPEELEDTVSHLVNNASLTSFQAGLRLGLSLGWENLLPHPLP